MSKTILQYRTFDQLLDEVRTDLPVLETEGFIEPAQLIKIAQKLNYELGLKIHGTKETMIEICNGKAKLPDDFYVLNNALLCSQYRLVTPLCTGTHKEDIIVDSEEDCSPSTCSCDSTPCCCESDWCTRCGSTVDCGCERCYSVCDGTVYVKVRQRTKYQTREYKDFARIHIVPSKFTDVLYNCGPDQSPYKGQLKDGYLYVTGVTNAKCYIAYQGHLEDESGNLLVLDHPMVNEYYEAAIKERVFENMYLSGEDYERKLMYMTQKKKEAGVYARNVVRTPDFQELYQNWVTNRKAQYSKYYDMFKSF